MDAPIFDPTNYHRAPSLTISTTVTLIDGLAIVHPRGAPALARKTLRKLTALRKRITDELSARRVPAEAARSAVEIDQAADRAWRATRSYLSAYLDLQPEFAPEQAEAQRLDAMLFGEGGLAFTVLQYPEQRTEMHDRLGALRAGDTFVTFTRIVGEACVKNLLATVKDYDGMVLGLLQATPAETEKLLPLVREAQKLVVDYARYLAATVDDEDPETVTAALQALAPIDNLRRMTATPRASVVKDTPVDPAPSPAPSPDTHP